MANYAIAPVRIVPRIDVLREWSAFLQHQMFDGGDRDAMFRMVEPSLYIDLRRQAYTHAFRGSLQCLPHWWSMLLLGTLWHAQCPKGSITLEGSDKPWIPNLATDIWLHHPVNPRASWIWRTMEHFSVRQDLQRLTLRWRENPVVEWEDVGQGFSRWYLTQSEGTLSGTEVLSMLSCDPDLSSKDAVFLVERYRDTVVDDTWIQACAHQRSTLVEAMLQRQVQGVSRPVHAKNALMRHPWFTIIRNDPRSVYSLHLLAQAISGLGYSASLNVDPSL